MSYPLISIITVVYNASSTLESSLQSVLSQDKNLFDYWIIDGGSTDGSIDIIKRYENHLAGWVSESDEGIYDAINKGIDRATGQWLYFLGADDQLIEGILAKVTPHLQPELAVVYGDVMFDTGHIMHSRIDRGCLLDNTLHHQGAFYNRTLFNSFRYNQKFRVYADYELTLRIYIQKQPSLYIPYIISIFAVGGSSHKLESADINTIRGLYLNNIVLNSLLSFILYIYYMYITLKIRVAHRLRKILKLAKRRTVNIFYF